MRKLVGLTLVLAGLICWAVPAQAQEVGSVGFGQKLDMQIGHDRPLQQGFGFHNWWVVTARHCQDYAKQRGHLWWKHWQIDEQACEADPSTVYAVRENHNLVTNAGYDQIASAVSNTATQAAAANYIAFAIDSSNSGAGTVAITDTTLASSGTGSTELAVNGLSRAQATYAHSAGTLTYTLTKAFSVTGTSTGVNKLGVFNAASSGSLVYELLFTPVTVNNLDTLTPTLTVTMSNP